MVAAVADTHAALWLLFGDLRLSTTAKKFFDTAAEQGRKVALSPISLVEIVYLVEKKRLPAGSFENLTEALKDPGHILEEGPFTSGVAAAMRQISREAVPDMPDRIVAATAIFLGVPIISRDGKIRASNVRTIW
ncbi:MAG: type II toxin-antitoxin system VapC family toxin [Terriglobia bacterium]